MRAAARLAAACWILALVIAAIGLKWPTAPAGARPPPTVAAAGARAGEPAAMLPARRDYPTPRADAAGAADSARRATRAAVARGAVGRPGLATAADARAGTPATAPFQLPRE